MIWRLLAKLGLLCLPLIFLTLALAGLAWHSGEAMPLSIIVERQQNEAAVIYAPAVTEKILDYKLASYQARRPEILILGNSLMLQIRGGFFNKRPATVYNAGVGGWWLKQIVEFYQSLDHAPALIITLIDFGWFNGESELDSAGTFFGPFRADAYGGARQAVIETVHRVLGGKLSIPQILERRDPVAAGQSLGLEAIGRGTGYRADGSRQLSFMGESNSLQDEKRASALRDFGFAGARFTPGSRINEDSFAMLDAFLAQVKADGVMLIGLTTPYHFQVHERMREAGIFLNMELILARTQELFAAYGFPYHHFSDMRAYGASGSEWYDSHHLNESGALLVLSVLFERHPDLFEDYVDQEALKALLAKMSNPMDVLNELAK